MKRRKKWISFLLAFAMLLPLCQIAAGAVGSFEDTRGHWAESYIEEAVGLGFINGYGDGRYGPDDQMTRAQFVTILWREAGQPEPAGKASFTDLNPRQTYYHKAVAWAEENGVMNGVGVNSAGENQFKPDSDVTREQIAATLFRMSGSISGMEMIWISTYEQNLRDSSSVSDWARSAVWWSVYNRIMCDTNRIEIDDTIAPRDAATRAQIAVMMVRYHEL